MTRLIINLYDSFCDSCGMSCDPLEISHEHVIGYRPRQGCGAVFTSTSSEYVGSTVVAAAREMRPDLPFLP